VGGAIAVRMTAAEFFALPDDEESKRELIDGDVCQVASGEIVRERVKGNIILSPSSSKMSCLVSPFRRRISLKELRKEFSLGELRTPGPVRNSSVTRNGFSGRSQRKETQQFRQQRVRERSGNDSGS
jgi:hypothetical protein